MSLFQSRINSQVDVYADSAHLNFMGGTSYDVKNPLVRLRLAASSCFFGEPMYYHRDSADKRPVRRVGQRRLSDIEVKHLRATLNAIEPQEWRGLSPAELIEKAVDAALESDPEATLREAVRLRSEEQIRTTPQVILVRAAHHARVRGTGLIRKYAKDIVTRADEPSVGLAYQMYRYGKPIPNSLKKAWRDALCRFGQYALAKYRMEGKVAKTVDVMNLVHPKSQAVDLLAKGQLSTTDKTWESIVSAQGSTVEAWTKALDVMGHMALLRNLRNLLQVGVPAGAFTSELVKGAKTGRQLPFRYYSAYQAVKSLEAIGESKGVLRAIEACLWDSIRQLPRFPGRVMALADNSGSAQNATTSSMGKVKISTIGNLTGILAAMRADEGYLGLFGDQLVTREVDTDGSALKQLEAAEKAAESIGQGTENGVWLFWDKAIRKKEHWDTVFVFSDMQAGHGGLYGPRPSDYSDFQWQGGTNIDVAALVARYRAKVNPNVLVFLVQIAGYQDTLVPEVYDRTYILGGWGEGLLRYAAEMAKIIP
ncbi:MAG: TROVE domain-containing protein [Polyangiaceae bacterium]|nr:TROVE domain-containing protein [Polyangiaceae bacterium]